MNELPFKINLSLREFEFSKLDTRWKTENFHLTQLGIPFARLYYPVEGKGYITLNGEKHVLEPGTVYLIAPYAPVLVDCPKRLFKYWGYFNARILDSPLDIFTFSDSVMKIRDDSTEFTTRLFKILCRTHPRYRANPRNDLDEMEGTSALTLLLAPFLRNSRETSFIDGKSTRFISLLSYIEEHLAEGLTLRKLADFCGLNPTYLSNSFAADTGIPLMKYCNQRSVHRALELMWSKKYTFSEIAYLVGMSNVTAFSRLFKKHTGFSPRDMRKQL